MKTDYKYLYLNLRSKLLSDKEQYLFDDTKEFIRNQEVIEFKKQTEIPNKPEILIKDKIKLQELRDKLKNIEKKYISAQYIYD
jgi:hypothetical protein